MEMSGKSNVRLKILNVWPSKVVTCSFGMKMDGLDISIDWL